MGDYKKYLLQIPIFSELTEEGLSEISELVLVRKYKKRQIMFVEGEPGEAIHFVINGKVKLSKSTADGRELILGIRQSGDTFAEVVLFDGGTYPATAEAIEDSEAGLIRNKDIDQLVRNNSSIAIALIKTMSRRLRLFQQQMRDLALKDTLGSMVSTLQRLAKEHGIDTPEGLLIDLSLTHQELANFIGTSRESVNRLLSDLKKSNVISVDKGKIMIIDMKKLKEWA
ncbi:cAMP-binding protein [Desulfuribacillus stibiiarsenatis]|uniref:cAMP-binding protein n=1 Tax=Desulfuribacillus stibiiarsenatis TaxID=1390249 RepID=A0A1E5L6Y5_9FIRM|nr:Crp/Fnr family transcriptional regulator [Desulfuribacillus stibiiarsenatis]OEH85917.1 cAMP-binding protein [Desulfuribacillus stibiiarsenatis]